MFDLTEEMGSNTKESIDQQMHDELSYHLKSKVSLNSGRWSDDEHLRFVEGIVEFGNDWKRVQGLIRTRSKAQARSHAQKFFSQIKKYVSVEELKGTEGYKLKQNSSISQREPNDSLLTRHLLEVLAFQDKEKSRCRISKLSTLQKEKLLSTVIGLTNSQEVTIRKRTGSTGIELDEDVSGEESEEDDEVDNIGASYCHTPNNSKANHNQKIFLIQKDNNKHKYSEPLSYTYKNISSSMTKEHRGMSHQWNESAKHSQVKECTSTPKSSEGDIYNEMKRFFMSKKESLGETLSMTMSSIESMGSSHMPPRICGNNRPHSTTNILDYNWLNNKNFFPNSKVESEPKKNTNPFTLNFDCFYSQPQGDGVNPKTIYEEDSEMMDVEYNFLGNKM